MKIIINFKDKTITVDNFSCVCLSIAPLETGWISLEVDTLVGNRLYKVGLIDSLKDIDFINPWVEEAINNRSVFKTNLISIEKEKLKNIENIELNKKTLEKDIEKYEKDYLEYVKQTAIEEEVDKQMILDIAKAESFKMSPEEAAEQQAEYERGN